MTRSFFTKKKQFDFSKLQIVISRIFFKFMIIREKHIPHVFSCQNHILTYQMGTPRSRFPVPYRFLIVINWRTRFNYPLKPEVANQQTGGSTFPPALWNLRFQIGCHDLRYFLKFMIIQEKLIPHVFRCQDQCCHSPPPQFWGAKILPPQSKSLGFGVFLYERAAGAKIWGAHPPNSERLWQH